jgi:hypothetical protein
MRLFVAACMTSRFEGFKPQNLSNVIHGEHRFHAPADAEVLESRRTCVW